MDVTAHVYRLIVSAIPVKNTKGTSLPKAVFSVISLPFASCHFYLATIQSFSTQLVITRKPAYMEYFTQTTVSLEDRCSFAGYISINLCKMFFLLK